MSSAESARDKGCTPRRSRGILGFLLLSICLASVGRTLVAIAKPAPVRVALTRENGQNDKLRVAVEKLLAGRDDAPRLVEFLELPCIEHGPGPDLELFVERLKSLVDDAARPEVVVVTSPEAARVFVEAWRAVAPARFQPSFAVAVVGPGTQDVLLNAGLQVAFSPSKANAATLAAELPLALWPGPVLYPASSKAATALQLGLESRGFVVERYDTYTTQGAASERTPSVLNAMTTVDVATFGSPTAVKEWLRRTAARPRAACIGATSRRPAERAGFDRVWAPEQPGLRGWASSVLEAVIDAGQTG